MLRTVLGLVVWLALIAGLTASDWSTAPPPRDQPRDQQKQADNQPKTERNAYNLEAMEPAIRPEELQEHARQFGRDEFMRRMGRVIDAAAVGERRPASGAAVVRHKW